MIQAPVYRRCRNALPCTQLRHYRSCAPFRHRREHAVPPGLGDDRSNARFEQSRDAGLQPSAIASESPCLDDQPATGCWRQPVPRATSIAVAIVNITAQNAPHCAFSGASEIQRERSAVMIRSAMQRWSTQLWTQSRCEDVAKSVAASKAPWTAYRISALESSNAPVSAAGNWTSGCCPNEADTIGHAAPGPGQCQSTKSLRDSPLKRGPTRGRGNQMRDRR